jgi:glycosyltransferase involved in cell wall biosynthesis
MSLPGTADAATHRATVPAEEHLMHIAFVTCELNRGEELYPGGLATYTYNVASGMRERGHHVTAFLSGSRDRTFTFKGLRVVESEPRLPTVLRPLATLLRRKLPATTERVARSLALRRSIRHTHRQDPVDVIHYSNWKSTGLFRLSLPSVLRISSYDPCFDNNPGSQHLDKRLSWLTERICIRRFAKVFGPGDHLAAIIERDLRLPRRIDILPTPFRASTTTSGTTFRQPGKHLVVYAGTISRFKGAELLMALVSRYLERYSDTVFLLAGKCGTSDGRSVRADVDALVQSHPDAVLYRPHLGRDELMAAFAQSDAVIVTSLVDNFPNTALEAMSRRAIVIASDTASLGTLIEDGRNGFIVRGRDADHWVDRIRDIVANLPSARKDSLRHRMEETLQGFSIEHALDRLEAYYQEAIDMQGSKAPRHKS